MQQIRKLGSMTKIMGMLPGMGQFRDQLENFDEREIDRIQAIIQSMTPAERDNPKMIDGSRRARIAKGSGPPGLRRQPARRPVLRGPQDDAADGPRRRHARHAGDARHGRRQELQARQAASRPRRARASASPATRPRPPSRRPQQKTASDEKAANPFGNPDGADVDYEKAPTQLNLPKDFSSSSSEAVACERSERGAAGARPRSYAVESSTAPTSSGPSRRLVEGPCRAARRLHERLLVADTSYDEIVLVLEGRAKAWRAAGRDGHVRTVHARVTATPRSRGAGAPCGEAGARSSW